MVPVAGAWNEPYLAELHAFPDGSHDDRVDASAGAFNAATEIDAAGGASVVNEPEGVVDERGTPEPGSGISAPLSQHYPTDALYDCT